MYFPTYKGDQVSIVDGTDGQWAVWRVPQTPFWRGLRLTRTASGTLLWRYRFATVSEDIARSIAYRRWCVGPHHHA